VRAKSSKFVLFILILSILSLSQLNFIGCPYAYSKIQSTSAQQRQITDVGLKKTIDVANYSLVVNANSNSLQRFGVKWSMVIITKGARRVFWFK